MLSSVCNFIDTFLGCLGGWAKSRLKTISAQLNLKMGLSLVITKP